jgi:hypothetical protein
MSQDDVLRNLAASGGLPKPLVVRVESEVFEHEVLEKLARLEAKMDMLAGGQQPGLVKIMEDRIMVLEKNDVKRSVYDRLLNAAIAFVISAVITTRDRWWR